MSDKKTPEQIFAAISKELVYWGWAMLLMPFYLTVLVVCGFMLWAMVSAWVL